MRKEIFVNQPINGLVDTKERILKSATKLFREKGYDGTSINEIIQHAGVSKGSLYYYFPSKQAILYEIAAKSIKSTNPFFKQISELDLSPIEKIKKISRSHIISVLNNLDFIAVGLHDVNKLEEPYKSSYISMRDQYQQVVATIIQEGIKEGSFGPLNVKLTTYVIFAILNSPQRWYKQGGEFTCDEIADTYVSIICDRILCKQT